MTNLSQVVNVQTMSSLEIAELTGKRHDHVLRDIDNILKTLTPDLGEGFKSSTYKDSTGKSNRCYEMDKDSTICLIAGYDVNARMRIVKRWQELETKQEQPRPQLEYTPAQRAEADFNALMNIAQRAEVPKSFALQECAKMASRASGCDITRLVTQGKDMNNVPEEDVMLEPTELGKHFGLSGKAMNEKLMDLDLQYRDKEGWKPTEKGKPLCERHAWAVKNKSGYNLKWRFSSIIELMKG